MAAVLLGNMPASYAAKASGPTKGTSCSRRNPCDTTSPSVSIATPASGATVAGSVIMAGTSDDNVGVAKVEVQIDDGQFQLASGTTSWSNAIDTRTLAEGSHTFSVRSTDVAGNAGTAVTTATVANATDDTTAPSISITAPVADTTVGGSIVVTGRASDDASLVLVEVQVDGGRFSAATGAADWSMTLDTSAYVDGVHTITARATDAAGNVATTTTTVTVSNATLAGDTIVTDPAAQHSLTPIGRTRMAQWGDLTGVIYSEPFTNRKVVFFRDVVTSATSTVSLPSDSLFGWSDVATVMTSPHELWVFGGTGPLLARRYSLSGSSIPSSASLVSSQSFGDGESRPGDLVQLTSGALVATWSQQAVSTPEAIFVAHRPAGGTWSTLPAITGMGSTASKQVLAQHPGDGAVWMFNN
ncbi:MAG TPA: Ig-like domain-containing protein, partial [Acidimicrobiales bacterium]|nr:Ig-like domain-containing protein [Acidimicrobiales bacterium]